MREVRTFTYNGIKKPSWLFVNKAHRPAFTPASPVTAEVPGKRGSYFFHNEKSSKTIDIDITVMAENDNDLWTKIEWLAGWLDQGEARELTFNDEPDRYYMAVFQSDGDALEQIAAMGSATLSFFCPDPYKYGIHQNYTVGTASNAAAIVNNGNADTQPIISVDFNNDANFFAVVGPHGLVQYGSPAGVEQETIEPFERVLTDYCWDLAPWSTSGLNIDFGISSGSFQVTDGHKFTVQNWGDDESTAGEWHGPVMRRSIPEPVQDFRAIFDIDLNNAPQVASRVEAWLLDAAGAIVARAIFWDRYLNGETNSVVVTAGPNGNATTILRSEGFPNSESMTWNGEFKGRIVINRQGNDWRASIKKLTKENKLSEASAAYDRLIGHIGNNNPIAQIQIGIRKYGNTNGFYGAFRDIAIERINNVPPEAAETIFKAGDHLEIDFTRGAAFLNGEYFNKYLDPASHFFSVGPGMTELRFLTTNPNDVTIHVDYDERYK